ncbi:MAG TPA: hypothetical protein VIK86_06605 [Candidatus Paceibacterota bacterium]
MLNIKDYNKIKDEMINLFGRDSLDKIELNELVEVFTIDKNFYDEIKKFIYELGFNIVQFVEESKSLTNIKKAYKIEMLQDQLIYR